MTAPQPDGRALYARLLKHVWPYRAALFAAIAAMVVGGLADAALVMRGVDSRGLDVMDRKLLQTIVEKFSGGPVGVCKGVFGEPPCVR